MHADVRALLSAMKRNPHQTYVSLADASPYRYAARCFAPGCTYRSKVVRLANLSTPEADRAATYCEQDGREHTARAEAARLYNEGAR